MELFSRTGLIRATPLIQCTEKSYEYRLNGIQ
jgi:hypothetical protein